MFRRLVITLLILSYAANQLAALPHAHASQPAEHAERAHVHSGWFLELIGTDAHPHQHRHGDDAHHHPHGHSHPQGKSAPALPSEEQHDDDCVYLPDSLPWIQEGGSTAFIHSADPLAVALSFAVISANARQLFGWCDSKTPPDRLTSGPPLYLTLRTLRI